MLYDILGIVGAGLILLGFYRTSIGKWKNKSFWYELDNTVGALLLVVYSVHHHAYISVVINTVWAIVAFRGLSSFTERYRVQRKTRKRRPQS
jgi:uncharacterized membrane protein